jgi:hypothetical protein
MHRRLRPLPPRLSKLALPLLARLTKLASPLPAAPSQCCVLMMAHCP